MPPAVFLPVWASNHPIWAVGRKISAKDVMLFSVKKTERRIGYGTKHTTAVDPHFQEV